MAAMTFAAMPGAGAHELTCNKLVDGTIAESISTYPTTLNYSLTVTNAKPTSDSLVKSADDDLLSQEGFAFSPMPPFTLSGGQSQTDMFPLTIGSYEDCLRIAALDGTADEFIDNTFTVTWDQGSATCTASVECVQPPPTPDGGMTDGGTDGGMEVTGATRTIGFYRTHEDAVTQCLSQGPINLGFITISTLDNALGILWGDPASFPDGTPRTGLDKDRFLLARQTLAGICNFRLFGTTPTPSDLLDQAVMALSGTNCVQILDLEAQVDAYNNSGDANAFPPGFDPGPSTPQDAKDRATDPTTPSGMTCSP